jgi:hypothetical protein
MYFNTTGSDNSAMGVQTLYLNTTGANIVAIGNYALQQNTTGSNNTAVGYQAGLNNTVSSRQTFVGYQAGYTSNAAAGDIQNTCVGAFAGYSLTTGAFNTFVGQGGGSGYFVTTGSYNTIVGGFTGNQGGFDIRTGSNYVVLSDGAGNCPIFTGNGLTVSLQGAGSFAGTGITFPATQSASSNANTLDDYEEGEWTPTFLSDGGTTGTQTNTSVWGRYIKIGRQVTVWFKWIGTLSGYTGTIQVAGLPFSVGTGTDSYQYGGNLYTVSSTATASNGSNFLFFAFSASLYPVYTTGQSAGYLFSGSTQINGLTEFNGSQTYYALA